VKQLSSLRVVLIVSVFVASACSPSAGTRSAATPPPTPTPSLSRTDPDIVEETDTYYIKRYKKADYIRVDDRHFRHPVIALPVEFYKEDADYYYVWSPKRIPEEERLKAEQEERAGAVYKQPTPPPVSEDRLKPKPEDYDSVTPPRVATRFRLEEVKDSGLPEDGLWRASFAVADMNGDGIPDIVSPPPRLGGDTRLRIWLGDGKGHFAPWKLRFLVNGKEVPNVGSDYGGVAIGDLDGDGHLDVVMASHHSGLFALYGDGQGTFTLSRQGFYGADFSTQAVALVDVDGDGKLDVVAAADTVEPGGQAWKRDQVQVFLNRGNRSFQKKPNALLDGSFSYSAQAFDFDRDGKTDVLLGSHYFGAVLLLYRNEGDGTFSQVVVPDLEIWAYHFAPVPGTFGKERSPAFADLVMKGSYEDLQAEGINVHVFRKGQWEKHVVFREKNYRAVLRTIAFGDVDGDGLDDIVFPDTKRGLLRIFLQQADGTFKEADEADEPKILPVAQCVRLADLNGDGRLDVVLAKTVESSSRTDEKMGGWTVFLNRPK